MSKRMPRYLIITGAVLLVLAGGLKVYSMVDDYLAGRRARLILEEMRNSASPAYQSAAAESAADDTAADNILYDMRAEQPASGESNAPLSLESTRKGQDYNAIGVLNIEKLRLELPVLDECTDSLLKISACRYLGDAQDKPERLVIGGHNYKSHFGGLSKLDLGDEVSFTNQSGIEYRYTVTEILDISMYDHDELEKGEWDISLFTCNRDGKRRVLVRCREV